MPQQIEYSPVRNGLDYLKSVIDHLQDEPTARDLKYAVLHLQAAAEVLLKVRLMREHWSLVFRNPDKANRAAFSSGDFQSIGMEEALTRLKGIVTIELTPAAQESLNRLAIVRNKLQHFGLVDQAIAIEALTGKVLDALLCFIGEHLQPGAGLDDLDALDEAQEIIRDEMYRINSLVDARWSRITPELDSVAEYVIDCPGCHQLALVLRGNVRCLFCDREWEDRNHLADEFAAQLIHVITVCPECELSAFLGDVIFRSDPTDPRWLCLCCDLIATSDEIECCSRCGGVMRKAKEEIRVCPTCRGIARVI